MTVLTKVANKIFEISTLNLLQKIEIFVDMRPYESENFKTLLLLQFWFSFNKTVSEYSIWLSSQKFADKNFKISNLVSLKRDWNLTGCKMWKWEVANVSKMANRRAKQRLGVVVVACIWGTFDLLMSKVILRSSDALVSKLPVTRKGWLQGNAEWNLGLRGTSRP